MQEVLSINHIVREEGMLSAKPRIAGRRVAVHQLVYHYQREGLTVAEIMDIYNLTAAQVHAALAYYYDHCDEIDSLINRDEEMQPPQDEQNQLRRQLLNRWQERTGHNPEEELTVSQVSDEYGISPQAVREACQRGWVSARKSGATWLLKRFSVHNRWSDK